MKNGVFGTRVCMICHKEFIRPKDNLYIINHRYKRYNCCSYTCYRAGKKLQQEKKYDELDRLGSETTELQSHLED